MSANASTYASTTTTTTTTTTNLTTKVARTSSSILLTPAQNTKRRKLDDNDDARTAPERPGSSKDPADAGDPAPAPTPAEIWRWTLTREALAPCFVKDVFEMKDGGHRDMEYFWLGRIPCRTVELVGVLVGIQVYEQRIVYALDDGTAVVDCNHKLSPQPVSPRKASTESKARSSSYKSSAYSPRRGPRPSSSKAIPSLPPPPKPIAEIGAPVRVTGRVVETAKGRYVLVDEIRPCASPNDEPAHWLAVLDLRRTRYFATELGPFVVPPPKKRAPPSWLPRSPEKDKGKGRAVDVPATPGRPEGVRDVEPRTPSTSGMASTDGSPASRAGSISRQSLKQTPIRLRHPTRLHRRDLTANTFRIYLKHYMDNAPSPDAPSAASSRAASPTPASRSQPCPVSSVTPRKPSRAPEGDEAEDRTPRASQLRARLREIERGMAMATPRAGKAPVRSRSPEPAVVLKSTDEDDETDKRYAFTLSHLRRVPELAVLARRVVNEEARRRAREERERNAAPQARSSSSSKAASTFSGRERPPEPRAKKMKRLFQFALRQLYDEGSIVLWDGPVLPLPSPAPPLTALWRADASTASAMSAADADADDPGEMSDPSPTEEAYLPLTPAVLAAIVERAIRGWIAAAAARRQQQQHRGRGLGVDPSAPLAPLAPPPGPTPAEIAAWLHRDARWARVGEWAVKDALEWGRAEGRVWCIGQGRWELCG